MARAKGVYFWTPEGKRFIDFNSQLMCVNIGHGEPRVIKAIQEQAAALTYVTPGMATEPRARLGAKLAEITPGDIDVFFFTNGGAEANENAFKIARAYTGRQKILARYRSYHGGTAAAIAATGEPRGWSQARCRASCTCSTPITASSAGGSSAEESLRYLEEVIQLEGPQTIAAFILESVTGTNGILIPPDGYMQGVRELCDQYGILMIADEVMSGFGRTGEWFAVEPLGRRPRPDHDGQGPDERVRAAGRGRHAGRASPISSRTGRFPAGSPTAAIRWRARRRSRRSPSTRKTTSSSGHAGPGVLMASCSPISAPGIRRVGAVRSIGLFGIVELVRNRETRDADGAVQRHVARDGRARQVLPRGGALYVRAVELLLHEPAAVDHRRRAARGVRDYRPGARRHGCVGRFQQIDVGLGDECGGRDIQGSKQGLRFAMALFDTLIWRQHDLELDETTQALDFVEVHARPPHEKHFAAFYDVAANRQHAAERADERRRVLAQHPRVNRFFWPGLVAALVRNELTRAIRKRADL